MRESIIVETMYPFTESSLAFDSSGLIVVDFSVTALAAASKNKEITNIAITLIKKC